MSAYSIEKRLRLHGITKVSHLLTTQQVKTNEAACVFTSNYYFDSFISTSTGKWSDAFFTSPLFNSVIT